MNKPCPITIIDGACRAFYACAATTGAITAICLLKTIELSDRMLTDRPKNKHSEHVPLSRRAKNALENVTIPFGIIGTGIAAIVYSRIARKHPA